MLRIRLSFYNIWNLRDESFPLIYALKNSAKHFMNALLLRHRLVEEDGGNHRLAAV
jgi:hypothetical protein